MVRQTEAGEIMPVKGESTPRCLPHRNSRLKRDAFREGGNTPADWRSGWRIGLITGSEATLRYSISIRRTGAPSRMSSNLPQETYRKILSVGPESSPRWRALRSTDWAGREVLHQGDIAHSTPRCTLMVSARAQRTLTSQCSASAASTGTSKCEARRISFSPFPKGRPQSQSGRFMGVILLSFYVFLHMLSLGRQVLYRYHVHL